MTRLPAASRIGHFDPGSEEWIRCAGDDCPVCQRAIEEEEYWRLHGGDQ